MAGRAVISRASGLRWLLLIMVLLVGACGRVVGSCAGAGVSMTGSEAASQCAVQKHLDSLQVGAYMNCSLWIAACILGGEGTQAMLAAQGQTFVLGDDPSFAQLRHGENGGRDPCTSVVFEHLASEDLRHTGESVDISKYPQAAMVASYWHFTRHKVQEWQTQTQPTGLPLRSTWNRFAPGMGNPWS